MIKQQLKTFRKEMEMSQKEIAKVFKVSQEAWCSWEKGRNKIPAYISRSIEFFELLPESLKQLFIK